MGVEGAGVEEEVPVDCHAELEIWKVRSRQEKGRTRRSTQRSGPLGRLMEAGNSVEEVVEEAWRDGGQLCDESVELGARWAW